MKKNLFIDVLMLSFTKIIIITASLVQGMILARALTKGEYAIYAQVLIPIIIVSNLFSLALPNSINFFAARANSNKEKLDFISKILTMIILLSLIGASFLFFGRGIISEYMNPEIYGALSIVFVLPIFRLVSAAYDNIFIVSNKTKKVVYRKTIMAILQIITVCYVWLFDKTVLTLFIILTSYELIMFIYMLVTINRDIGKIKFKFFKRKELKTVLYFVLPLAVASFVGTLNKEIDKILINHYFGAEKFAEYAVVAKELPLTVIATSVSAIIVPQIAKYLKQQNYNKVIKLWENSVEISFISTSWIVGILILCSTEIVTILFSEKYADGAPVFSIFAVILLFRIIYFGMLLNGSGNTSKILISAALSFISNILFFFLLKPYLGYYAAPVSTLISVFVMNITQLLFAKSVISVSFKQIMPWFKLFKITLVNIVIGFILIFLKEWLYNQFNLHYILTTVIISLTWFIIFFLIYYRRFIKLKNSYTINEI